MPEDGTDEYDEFHIVHIFQLHIYIFRKHTFVA